MVLSPKPRADESVMYHQPIRFEVTTSVCLHPCVLACVRECACSHQRGYEQAREHAPHVFVSANTHTHVRTHARTHASTHARTDADTHKQTHTHANIHTHTSTMLLHYADVTVFQGFDIYTTGKLGTMLVCLLYVYVLHVFGKTMYIIMW